MAKKRKFAEAEVKRVFHDLANELAGIRADLVNFSADDSGEELGKANNALMHVYGFVCNPGAVSPDVIKRHLDLAVDELEKGAAILAKTRKATLSLARRIKSQKIQQLSQNLWFR